MAGRRGLLDRLVTALAQRDVDGVLGSPDVVEELLLLGALEGRSFSWTPLARSSGDGRVGAGDDQCVHLAEDTGV